MIRSTVTYRLLTGYLPAAVTYRLLTGDLKCRPDSKVKLAGGKKTILCFWSWRDPPTCQHGGHHQCFARVERQQHYYVKAPMEVFQTVAHGGNQRNPARVKLSEWGRLLPFPPFWSVNGPLTALCIRSSPARSSAAGSAGSGDHWWPRWGPNFTSLRTSPSSKVKVGKLKLNGSK